MNPFLRTPAQTSRKPTGQRLMSRVALIWSAVMLLAAFSLTTQAQTVPASITVSGACLSGAYPLTLTTTNYEGTNRPAYEGVGSVTIDGTPYSDVQLAIVYEPNASVWVLALDGQPYQSNASTASTPPATGWQAIIGDGTIGPCTGNTPLSVQLPTTAAPVVAAPANGALTSDNTPTYTGTAPAGSTVTVYVDGSSVGTTTAAGGTFSLTPTTPLANGSHTVYARAQLSGFALSANSNTNTFMVDATAPTVTITSSAGASGGTTSTSPIPFTVTFSENVTGFVAADVSVTNGTVSGFAGSGSSYSVNVTPTANGLVTVAVPANVAQDAAGNGNTAAPQFSITYALLNPTIAGFSASPAAVCLGGSVGFTATIGNVTGTYAFTLTNGSSRSTGSASAATFAQTLTPQVTGNQTFTLTVAGANGQSATATTGVTVNALPSPGLANNGPLTCPQTSVTLTASGGGTYAFAGPGLVSQNTPIGTAVVGSPGTYSVTVTNVSGCPAVATTTVTSNTALAAPTLLTQSGQSALSVDLNSGNVILLATGCAGGTIIWTGSNNTSGTGGTIIVPTTQPGTFVYQARCRLGVCTSDPASATVTVGGRVTVLHRDVDNYADNNAIQPLLQVQNQGSGPLALSALTLRYYLTVEGASPLSNLFVNYAQVGNQNVRLRYVPLVPVQAGAQGYVEVGFTPGAGSLAAGGSTGPIQSYFAKGDYSGLNELDDYSYATVRDQLMGTLRITAYYNGVLIAGQEPGAPVTPVRAVRALTESKNGPSATQINTYLEVRNEGNVPISYSDLKARYYFTADGAERLQVEVDEGNVRTQLVRLPQPVAGADHYLEISFNQPGQLAPGASTGTIRYRISKPDGGRFTQTNDYSYQEQPAERSQNSRVVVYVGSDRIWGTEPGAGARLAAGSEPVGELTVRVLGNPVTDDAVAVEVEGAQGQPLRVRLLDNQGREVGRQQRTSAESVERLRLDVGSQPAGLLLLQVSTPTRSQTLKVLKQ